MSGYVVGMFTMGSFREFTDPFPDLAEAREFIADPPDYWTPRPQDSLRIFELHEVPTDTEEAHRG